MDSGKQIKEKDYYSLSDLKPICDEYIEYDKYREKIIRIFKILRIDTDYLKDKPKGGRYRIPKSSVAFMKELYDFYTDPEGQELRKGNIDKVSLSRLLWIIEGFEKMYAALGLPYMIIDVQIQSLRRRLAVEEKQIKEEIREILNDMILDIYPKEVNKHDLREDVFAKNQHFRYTEGMLDWNELSLFFRMVKEDLEEIRFKHHRVFEYMRDIRVNELNESIEEQLRGLSEEELYKKDKRYQDLFTIDNLLFQSDDYIKLVDEKMEVEYSNDFIIDKERKLKRIKKEMDQIVRELTREHLGDKYRYLGEDLDDAEDYEWEKSPEEVFNEAVEEYRRNDTTDDSTLNN